MSAFFTDANNDLTISQGKLVLETDTVIAAALALKHKFLHFKGEWFLDTRTGVPYLEAVLVKNPDPEIIKRIFRRVLLSTPPIVDASVDIEIGSDRNAAITFVAVAQDGTTITGGPGLPFIVTTTDGEDTSV